MADETQIQWTEDALKSVEKAPLFLRGMVKKLAEKKARDMGLARITAEQLTQWKNESMGAMGGEKGLQEAADQMAKGPSSLDTCGARTPGNGPGLYAGHGASDRGRDRNRAGPYGGECRSAAEG